MTMNRTLKRYNYGKETELIYHPTRGKKLTEGKTEQYLNQTIFESANGQTIFKAE